MSSTESGSTGGGGNATPWIVAAVCSGFIIAFGVYQARQRASMEAEDPASSAASMNRAGSAGAAEMAVLVEQAGAARGSLDRGKLERAIIDLDAARGQDETGEISLALARVLAAHAIEARMAAHVPGADTEEQLHRARTSAGRAAILLEELESRSPAPAGLGRLQAELEIARGGDVVARFPRALLPAPGSPELPSFAMAISMMESAGAEVPSRLLDELTDREEPRVRLAAALLHKRAGADDAALASVAAVLADIPGHALATELRASGGPVVEAQGGTGLVIDDDPEDSAPPEEPTPEPVAEPAPAPAPEPPAPTPPPPVTKPKPRPTAKPRPDQSTPRPKPSSRPKPPPSGGTSFDALVTEGCRLVRSGDAQKGFTVLTEAFDKKPGGTKITLCLAEAHDKLGRTAAALSTVERVLRKSPSNKRARLLAARLEAKRGNTTAARSHYQKVLEIDPDDATARGWLEQH